MLRLSPTEYYENLERMDDNRKITAADTSIMGVTDEVYEEFEVLWEHLGMDYGREGWQETFQAKLACTRALRSINLRQETVKKEILSRGIRELYSNLVKDPKGSEYITIADAYDRLYHGKDSSVDHQDTQLPFEKDQRLLAIHNFLLADSDHFVADWADFLASARFRIRTKEEGACLRQVSEWIRSDSPEVVEFQKKAKNIHNSASNVRKSADATTAMPLPLRIMQVPNIHSWTASDLAIIEFLRLSLDMKRKVQVNPFEAGAAVLVKSLEKDRSMTEESLFAEAGDIPPSFFRRTALLRLLKDIGVYQDWDNPVIRERELGLQEWTQTLNKVSDDHDDGSPISAQKGDSLDSVRHDFGNIPVYTIDDASASELDDGISLEPCPSLLDSRRRPTYWVHIHIADPTSTLQPNDSISTQAKMRQSTVYFPEMTWPMVPFDLIQERGWSLGSPSPGSKHQEQKVLSFSARLDQDGNVLEKLVRAGIIRNVWRITYQAVDTFLGVKVAGVSGVPKSVLTWPTHAASSFPSAHPAKPVEPVAFPGSAKEDLPQLRHLGHMLLQRRVNNSAIQWNSPSSTLLIAPRPLLPHFDIPASPLFYSNTPLLRLELPQKSIKQGLSPSQALVAEFMILAGSIAAAHSAECKIPSLFRGQERPKVDRPGALEKLLSLREPTSGEIDANEVFRAKIQFQSAYFSPVPVAHWPMGIKEDTGGYVRVTSPLRRYEDLLAHWQIKSTLAKDRVKPPFSAGEVGSIMGEIERIGRLRTRMERRARSFWKLFLVQQKLREIRQDPSSDPFAAELLLNGLSATIGLSVNDLSSLQKVVHVTIPELGLPAILMTHPMANTIAGKRYNVDIAGIVLDDYSKLYVKLKEVSKGSFHEQSYPRGC